MLNRFFAFSVFFIFYSVRGNSQYIAFPNYSLYNPPKNPENVAVKGSTLLFDSAWAHAKVVSENNGIIQNDSIFFNFNKLSQNRPLTRDYKKICEVDKREYKSVTFYWHDSDYIFERIIPSHFKKEICVIYFFNCRME